MDYMCDMNTNMFLWVSFYKNVSYLIRKQSEFLICRKGFCHQSEYWGLHLNVGDRRCLELGSSCVIVPFRCQQNMLPYLSARESTSRALPCFPYLMTITFNSWELSCVVLVPPLFDSPKIKIKTLERFCEGLIGLIEVQRTFCPVLNWIIEFLKGPISITVVRKTEPWEDFAYRINATAALLWVRHKNTLAVFAFAISKRHRWITPFAKMIMLNWRQLKMLQWTALVQR